MEMGKWSLPKELCKTVQQHLLDNLGEVMLRSKQDIFPDLGSNLVPAPSFNITKFFSKIKCSITRPLRSFFSLPHMVLWALKSPTMNLSFLILFVILFKISSSSF